MTRLHTDARPRLTLDLGDLPDLPIEIVVHLRMLALTAHNLARLGHGELAIDVVSNALRDGGHREADDHARVGNL